MILIAHFLFFFLRLEVSLTTGAASSSESTELALESTCFDFFLSFFDFLVFLGRPWLWPHVSSRSYVWNGLL